ncbi:hypothetical protein [Edaphobacter aggregans]|uniref:hypothetical protein n=1 Tax=Edaphobacter aggregans TaxID=570835 RepID=UPI000F735722|nr:hypothetical protein [Edaphobacter aggregans]
MDWKSTTTLLPPDAFATAFSALASVGGKITLLSSTSKGIARGPADISSDQESLLSEIQDDPSVLLAKPGLEMIKQVLQAPPVDICSKKDPRPWTNAKEWKADVELALRNAIVAARKSMSTTEDLAKKVDDLGAEIRALPADQTFTAVLKQNQTILTNAIQARLQLGVRFQTLLDALDVIPDKGVALKSDTAIRDSDTKDKNYQSQVWGLNYLNKLTPVAKRVSTTTPAADPGLLGTLAETPVKQPIISVTVQFQSPQRLEVSSGLMVPTSPYHTYTKASVATNGIVTDNIVQENLTYTVVPVVSVNFLIGRELIARKQRVATFATVAVGYNPATSAVEFGTGLAFSWRSIVLSGLADVGRDMQLAGGFKIGESLGLTNAATPLTTTRWGIRPAVALSVRIPLGGASK